MSSSITSPDTRPRAEAAVVEAERLRVTLTDGREISIPTAWYAWLHDASAAEQADVEIIEGGLGLWWNTIDDGLSVPGLLGLPHM
jgi:hypothetical protein